MRLTIVFVLCLTIAGAAWAQFPAAPAGGYGGNSNGQTVSPADEKPSGPMVAGVTITIPKMPVKDAIVKIDQGWQFDGELGDRTMPGAKFINYPRNMAAAMMLASAGLVPPDDGKTVTELLGDQYVNTLGFFKWDPLTNTAACVKEEGPGGPKLTKQRRTSNAFTIDIPSRPTVMAIGGCEQQTKQGVQMVYTILTSQVTEKQFFEFLFNIIGAKYSIGDLTLPRATEIATKDPNTGEIAKIKSPMGSMSIIGSYQLYDTTVDGALKSISNSNGLLCTNTGTEKEPNYLVEVNPAE